MDGFNTVSDVGKTAWLSRPNFNVITPDTVKGYNPPPTGYAIPRELIPISLDLKKKYSSVFYLRIGDFDFFFRLAKRYEFDTYKTFASYNGDSNELRFDIFSSCILYQSHDNDSLLAFTMLNLVNTILRMSDFEDLEYFDELQFSYEESLSKSVLKTTIPWMIRKSTNDINKDDHKNMDIAECSEHLGAMSFFSGGESKLVLSPTNKNRVQSTSPQKNNRR